MSYLSRLYASSDNDKDAEAYISEHELELLMATDDRTSSLISAIALGLDAESVSEHEIKMLEAKGFLKKTDSYNITERGMKLVSEYPLFGKYEKARKYNHSFFPMLISSIVSKELSSRATHWTRYFSSDFFTSLFPSRDSGEISRSAIAAVRALLELGILRDNLGRMTIRKDSCLSFMALSDEDKLSWILYPDKDDATREKASKAINLIFRLRGIKEDKLQFYLNRIEAIAGFVPERIDMLFDFGVLYLEDGIINGYELDLTEVQDGIISSDFILSYHGYTDKPIYLICQPEKADVSQQWAITRKSLKSAFSMGYMPDEIKNMLSCLSSESLPDTLSSRIDSWYESFRALTAERGVILTADSRNSKILDSLPLLKLHILSHPSENIFIMNPSTEEEWRRVLHFSGFDMLGETKGWEMHRPEKERTFALYGKIKSLKREREIPFSKSLRKILLSSAKSPLRRLLVETGFIFTEEAKEFVDIVEGLYYQEKLRMITSAIQDKDMIYIESIDSSIRIERPIELIKNESSAYLKTDRGEYSVATIWKIGVLPGFIRSLE